MIEASVKRPKTISPDNRRKIISAYKTSAKRLILLDYDGTLVSFTPTPALARPGPKLITCLSRLGDDTRNNLVIISGRDKNTLESWLGRLPVNLNAEHGAFEKTKIGWKARSKLSAQWMKTLLPILESAKARLPGTEIEKKVTALVFHYRLASEITKRDNEVKRLVGMVLPLAGQFNLKTRHDTREMVVEIKPADTDKGAVARRLFKAGSHDFIFCAGDSTSDEEMFATLPAEAINIKVGSEPSLADFRVGNPAELIALLNDFLKS